MKEIDSNKDAWIKISEDHYYTFKALFQDESYKLNDYIKQELGDITGKDIIHLQCNTGADTIALAQLGAAHVVGVDLVPENVFFAKKLASDLGITNVDFVESDIMTLEQIYNKKHEYINNWWDAIFWNTYDKCSITARS